MTPSVIDAHQHIWSLQRATYAWLDPNDENLARDHTIDEALTVLDRSGIGGTVLVQSADNAEDSALMFEAARFSKRVRGVVAWAPLDQPGVAERMLDRWSAHPSFCGIRNLIHTRADSAWIASESVKPTLSMLAERGIPLDVVAVDSGHLRAAITIGEQHPALRMVIDHLGHPPIKANDDGSWAMLMAEAAANPNTHAKISGLYPASGARDSWNSADLSPWIEQAIDMFSPQRLMYGGDWPISLNAGGYARVWQAMSGLLGRTGLLRHAGEGARRRILAGTATEFYSL